MQLMGGLGNQMFQYAAAKALSLKRNIPFATDFDDPYIYAKRSFGLDVFNLEYQTATTKQLSKSKPKTKVMRRLYKWTGNNPDKYLYREKKDFHYQPEFFDCNDGSYISGFWQSEKYFLDIADTIRRDFSFKNRPSAANSAWLEKIKACNAVSIHIRRGDYVSVAHTNQLHGTCNLDYYQQAINAISGKVENPVFFCFSDDIEWTKANLKTGAETHYVDCNTTPDSGYQDMRLMSNCKHHIIANSSFSWWGAWLNPDADKVVIAPKKWLNSSDIIVKDLIPDTWLKL
ncbi:alpha-1,2-fucosyltransferase [Mucilaginibacter sp. HMF5004]|nr:alpha-1,2-fucosyltransferase [Mucilaginibacter rivuli]